MVGHRGATLAVVIGLVAVASLAGCSLQSGASAGNALATGARDAWSPYDDEPAPGSASPDVPEIEHGTTDWPALETCAPDVSDTEGAWSRVAGYPEAAFDGAGIVAECGYTGSGEAAAEAYVGVVSTVDDGSIYSFGGQLTRDGWALQYDDFVPEPVGAAGDYAGSREYVNEAGDLLRIEAYDNGTIPASFTTYFDYSRPRAGQPS
jgi:hypothetical protein